MGKLTHLFKTFMFTPKANSMQKMVKKAQKCKNWNSDSMQHRMTRTVRACRAHGRARQTTHIFWFLSFNHFARKIQTVNPFSMQFSPTRSLHLALSHSKKKFKFLPFQNNLSKITYDYLSFEITYTSFSLKTPSFFPKLFTTKTYDQKLKFT